MSKLVMWPSDTGISDVVTETEVEEFTLTLQ